MKFRHRSGKTGLKSKVKCYYLPRGRLYLPSPSPFRKQCPTFLGSSFSWEWDKRRKCSDSILTPDWQEPKGGARNHAGHHLSCDHQWQRPKQQSHQVVLFIPLSLQGPTLDTGTHRNLVNNKAALPICLTFSPFQEANLCSFSSLFTDSTISVDLFLLSQVFTFLSIRLS